MNKPMRRQHPDWWVRPVSPPRTFEGLFSADQERRILRCIREAGPYLQISAQYVDTAEESRAINGGDMVGGPEGWLAPTFHGALALDGVSFHREVEDIFFSPELLDLARGYWNAECAKPTRLFVNINGPTINKDPGHLDIPAFRGVDRNNMPMWALSLMGKSGLFQPWLIKMAQVITWWWKGCEDGGFTYWPDGLHAPPARVTPPVWNRSVLVQNEMMHHRAESNGVVARRQPAGVTRHSVITPDPEDPSGWLVKTGDQVLDRVTGDELRIMLHWNAEIFYDREDLKRHADHTDDLTPDRAFEMLCADLRARGRPFQIPTDPARDQAFIRLLADAYDLGAPRIYPEKAPPEAA